MAGAANCCCCKLIINPGTTVLKTDAFWFGLPIQMNLRLDDFKKKELKELESLVENGLFGAICRDMLFFDVFWGPFRLRHLFYLMDADGDGTLDWEEQLGWLNRQAVLQR